MSCVDFDADVSDLGADVCDGYLDVGESAHDVVECVEDKEVLLDVLIIDGLLGHHACLLGLLQCRYLVGVGGFWERHSRG